MKARIHFLVGFIIFLSFHARGTGNEVYNLTYTFKNVPAGIDLTEYQLALENSDFECYRFESQRRTFQFENGMVLEIFSAQEVQLNTSHTSTCFLQDNTSVPQAILSLGDNHTIIMSIESKQKTHMH